MANTTERIALAFYNQKNYLKAEAYCQKLLTISEKLYGGESGKVAGVYTFLGDIYRSQRLMEAADVNYLMAININDRILTREQKKERTDIDNYTCFLYHKGYQENRFMEASAQVRQFRSPRFETVGSDRAVQSGVLNGKAIKLAKPSYPRVGARGFVVVTVTIDETGKVIEAKGECGIRGFFSASEEAARRSKFTPTLLNGIPVRVSGTILYNFGSN
ncbi:MAG: tetratricopeptide repeat protein [Pyrinomonadaceae bacterium]